MEQDTKEQSASRDEIKSDVAFVSPSQGDVVGTPPTSEAPCPTCAGTAGSMPVTYVYASGHIKALSPHIWVEKELVQATGRAKTAGQTDQKAFFDVLSKPENRYLARQMCWVLTIQGLESYILQPRDPRDIDWFVEAINPQPSPMINVVIGMRGPIAPPEFCNGLMLPFLFVYQMYSFLLDDFIKAIPRPGKMTKEQEKQYEAAARELLDRILQMTDNAGATDEHRALNYAVFRYDVIHAKTAEEFARDFSLTGVDVRPSLLSGAQKILNVILAFTNRKSNYTKKYYMSVNVDGPFPFLTKGISEFLEVL
jgi:PatG Domain